ncbi:hypothetical protein CWR48_05295 [Oceanobacillus arenosus]|uniref:Uncharacterized protein n=1 Tax=Oceanobacillus arenosus TaxID=1229153 RepID=A0A3D8PVH3_9BACI|nr:hypothetical protein CWR48_05295 [Oceanobacillus arenosus]
MRCLTYGSASLVPQPEKVKFFPIYFILKINKREHGFTMTMFSLFSILYCLKMKCYFFYFFVIAFPFLLLNLAAATHISKNRT